jgi:hypothetical protein
MKAGVFIMPIESVPVVYFIIPFHQYTKITAIEIAESNI